MQSPLNLTYFSNSVMCHCPFDEEHLARGTSAKWPWSYRSCRSYRSYRLKYKHVNKYRGVATGRGGGGPGVPATSVGRPSFEQTTYNISGGENAMTISWP